MKNITIRKADEKDFPAILDLIKELATFEKAPNKVTTTVEQMKKEKDFFHCLIAETEEKEIVGIALYFFAYYTFVGKSLYLPDLIVKESFRGRKIGTALLKKIFDLAKEQHCKKVRWRVHHLNKPAINFYKKAGAAIDDEWNNCDFDVKAIENFKL